MHPHLSTAVLARLREPRPYPALSILMPTHRREPDDAQDRVRLRNLVAEAEQRLEADPAVARECRLDVVGQLRAAVSAVDPAHAEEGLVLFAAPGEHHVWTVSRAVPERVVLSDTFLTRNLVAARTLARPYWVLVVAADRVSLWSGAGERLTERSDGTFPVTRSLEKRDVEREERVGDVPGTYGDERTRQFLRDADVAAVLALDADPRPLYIVGDAPALSLLAEVGTVAKHALTTVTHGGLAAGPASAVRDAVAPAVGEQSRHEVASLLGQLDRARSQKTFAGGLDEVWRGVSDGRVGLLAVEDTFRVIVRDHGDHLEPVAADEADARQDVVDEIVERALSSGARVRFVPDGTLAAAGRIASVLRH
ncbi:chemotaxis protein [Streptomyces sp. NPDC053755]|uniref:baeRF3 domain-containing protein n=1 Tax=Streptomyces sp. NPDC053755 TaxID=3155815 RepID=UPI003415B579